MSIEIENPEGVAGKIDAVWNLIEQIGLALMVGDIEHAKKAKANAARLLSLATEELAARPTGDDLDEDSPLWCINEQIKGLLQGEGASEDHAAVIEFLRSAGLPEGTAKRVHRAIVCGDSKTLWRTDEAPKDGTVILAQGNITQKFFDGETHVMPFTDSIYWTEDIGWMLPSGLGLVQYIDAEVTIHRWQADPA